MPKDPASAQAPSGKEDKKDDLQKKVAAAAEASAAEEEAQQADEEKQEVEEKELGDSEQIDELKEQLARCMADMQNFKRRAEEDKSKWIKFANYELLKELLPIIDNFDRACQQIPDNLKDDGWVKGVVHTHDDMMKALEKFGVKRIETVGKPLDPNLHEAVMQGEGEKDVIIEEFEPGYTYHEQTLKAAKVKVGSGKS
jgi:molecular chaperone GrpE